MEEYSSTKKAANKFVLQIPTKWKQKIAGNTRKVLIPATLRAENFHHIKIIGSTEFHDYETFGPDEHGTFSFLQESVLSTQGPSVTLLKWQQGFGGEERVEIDIVGSLSNTGACLATIDVRFFEGATEGTHELEDSDSFQTIVPAGRTSNFFIHLANDEDDWAKVRGSISNTQL
jgi:hypothetical protein